MKIDHKRTTIEEFARFCHDLVKSDRDINLAVGGFTGEGKSTFAIKVLRAYSKVSKVKWSFDHITWLRKELLTWINGEGDDKKGQLPEYSGILVDELVSLFYKRNWYEDGQKSAVELFNKCRDRHLLIIGNIPDFWDLDSGFLSRIRFYIYIKERGVAWVFEQENNPFVKDKWNQRDNLKVFRQYRSPYKCPNFLFEINFGDLDKEEKKKYLNIRNTKRVGTEGQQEKIIVHKKIREQRNKLLRLYGGEHPEISDRELSEILGLERSCVSRIRQGVQV